MDNLLHDDYYTFISKTMRARTFAETIRPILDNPLEAAKYTPAELIKLGIQEQMAATKTNRINREIAASHIPYKHACLEETSHLEERNLSVAYLSTLTSINWETSNTGLWIHGASGCGKTFLACAIGINACRKTSKVRYYRFQDLMADLEEALQDVETLTKLKRQLQKVHILIIDDWFVIPPATSVVRELFSIIDSRYQQSAVIITSQTTPKTWHSMIEEKQIADALVGRITHMTEEINLGKHDMRKTGGTKLRIT